ncbi:hypothetical protein SPHINGOAX6_70162 [Sphingomonas sp. AX6]|nr:hypothetical protein SPHINGOAX6_70162 [Sphingomonas sp. AX6]
MAAFRGAGVAIAVGCDHRVDRRAAVPQGRAAIGRAEVPLGVIGRQIIRGGPRSGGGGGRQMLRFVAFPLRQHFVLPPPRVRGGLLIDTSVS